ncbi:MAG: precorrin-6y C5,15-methyltransferase (decarboxylating) subunit CbiE [Verrucomicrobia bacterium]|nr:precorrin-6y C5,15-methyltransferase (decarboxylating) subunit CbiE [Verrucomicrobiota bacterium]
MNTHKITIVGCGPGALDYLTPVARAAIEHAKVLVGAQRLLDLFPTQDAERIVVKADIETVLGQIAARAGQKRVVALVTGDPGLCSLATPIVKRFGRAACQIIPGVSSVQVAFARLGLDWLDARIVTAHDKKPDTSAAALVREKKLAVLAGNDTTQPWIASLATALAASHQVFVCENLTLPDERIRQIKPSQLQTMKLASRTIVLLLHKEVLQ